MHQSKQYISSLLEKNEIESVAFDAAKDRKIISRLIRIAYHKETLIGWRAIRSIGLTARVLIKTDYEFLRETCRRLLWSLSDESGGIGWSAPEILGEIVSADPECFSDIIPLIAEVYDIEEKIFRPGVLYALGRIADKGPDRVLPFKEFIGRALSEGDALSRIYAIELLKILKSRIGKDDMDSFKKIMRGVLLSDRSEAWIYKNNGFLNVEVGEYVRAFLSECH